MILDSVYLQFTYNTALPFIYTHIFHIWCLAADLSIYILSYHIYTHTCIVVAFDICMYQHQTLLDIRKLYLYISCVIHKSVYLCVNILYMLYIPRWYSRGTKYIYENRIYTIIMICISHHISSIFDICDWSIYICIL